VYFPLKIDAAIIEAQELISKGLIWIYESEGEVTSICAVTRSTQNVSAITKVYTTPKWRRRGFAEHLVRNVTGRFVKPSHTMVFVLTHHAVTACWLIAGSELLHFTSDTTIARSVCMTVSDLSACVGRRRLME
jgi:predicted GNAT family acetyltransferase